MDYNNISQTDIDGLSPLTGFPPGSDSIDYLRISLAIQNGPQIANIKGVLQVEVLADSNKFYEAICLLAQANIAKLEQGLTAVIESEQAQIDAEVEKVLGL